MTGTPLSSKSALRARRYGSGTGTFFITRSSDLGSTACSSLGGMGFSALLRNSLLKLAGVSELLASVMLRGSIGRASPTPWTTNRFVGSLAALMKRVGGWEKKTEPKKKNTLTLSKTTKTSTKQKKPKQNAKQKEKRLFRFATEKWFQPKKRG